MHCTVGERSTDRDGGSGSGSGNDNDNINWELLDDSHWQIPWEGGLVLGLCHHFSHLRWSEKVRTVHRVYQARRAGNSRLCWKGRRQGHRIWRRAIEASAARIPPKSWGCCEKRLAYRRSTQLAVTITAYGSGIADCPSQWLRNQDIRQSAKRQCSRSRSWSRKSCGRGTPDWRVIPAGCESCRKEISSEGIIVSEELQARLIVSEEL